MNLSQQHRNTLTRALERAGQRATHQREQVFASLLSKRDHPTAEEVYGRVRQSVPTISLATVYNCLEALVGCGLVRMVHSNRGSTRYCPDLSDHAHFQDLSTGKIHDVALPEGLMASLREVLPPGFEAEQIELYYHGRLGPEANGETPPENT